MTPIKYFLQPNPLTTDPEDQRAVVVAANTLNQDDIVQGCVDMGSTVGKADLKAAFELIFTVIANAVANGNNVVTPLVNLKPSIKGNFINAADTFDSSRHTIGATISMGTGMRQRLTTATVEKVTGGVPSPDIIQYFNLAAGENNAQAKIGAGARIIGSQLKFNPANAPDGVYFVPQGAGATIKVTQILSLTEGEIMFIVPAIAPLGQYFLEVRRAYTQANVIRQDRWDAPLAVIA
ncbi:MAG: DUF4469 domain-containing protein [Bacteroidetes bacterium]|nr:DUF4469 domain-containing protein [Bacteroidota bacterium]